MEIITKGILSKYAFITARLIIPIRKKIPETVLIFVVVLKDLKSIPNVQLNVSEEKRNASIVIR